MWYATSLLSVLQACCFSVLLGDRYDAQDDTLFTGDLSGYARVVDNATGILYAVG